MSTILDSSQNDNPLRKEAILQDRTFVNENVSPAAVVTLTDVYVVVAIMRTAYSRVTLRVQYTEDYPHKPPIVELTSTTLPPALLRNKEKECMEKAAEHQGNSQYAVIYDCIDTFIQYNMFLPCWKEIKQLATQYNDASKGKMSADEKEGIIKIKMIEGGYRLLVKIKIPYQYPEEGVKIDFLDSNFTEDILYMFKSQAEEIIRRCEAGLSAEQALLVSNPIKLAQQAEKSSAQPIAKLTTGTLKSLKHDVEVLNQMKNLRVAAEGSGKKQYILHANAEKREARKDLRRLAKAEHDADEVAYQQLLDERDRDVAALMKTKTNESAVPSLAPLVKFLSEHFAHRLPNEKCQACQKCVLPIDPTQASANTPIGGKKSRKDKDMRPLRTFCGHWLHYSCLDEWLTTPPFLRQCPQCDRRIWHPDWPEDHKQLEKAWQVKEARNREMSDVSDFMGVGSEFSV